MRMWGVPTKMMCRKHLLAEHLEIHMFVTHLNLNRGVDGFLDHGLLEIHRLHTRHDELVKEMERRKYKHRSELLPLVTNRVAGHIDVEQNLKILAGRCPDCRLLQEEYMIRHQYKDAPVDKEKVFDKMVDKAYVKPQCSLVGIEKNIFAIINKVALTLKRTRGVPIADKFCVQAFETNSKERLMEIVQEFVEVI